MKKVLMGTTALVVMGAWAVSPAAAQEKIKINVGGYFMNALSYTDQSFDDPMRDYHPVTVRQEGEIHFTGETTLDNGLTVGVNVQLEANTVGDQIDESYVYWSGDFGKVIVGAENSVAYLMGYSAPAVGLGVNSPTFYPFAQQSSAPTSTYVTGVSDSNKLSYFSPRFSGFQLGLSYTPNTDARGGMQFTSGLSPDNGIGDLSNFVSVGLNFVNSFNGIDVAVSGTYERGDLEANNVPGAYDDPQDWQIGANLGFAGFTVGGSYRLNNANLVGNNNLTAWDAGISYETGPWGVSFAYFRGEQQMGAGVGDDELNYIELGGSYALGPGIKVFGGVQRFDEDSDTVNKRSDGWAATVATKLSF